MENVFKTDLLKISVQYILSPIWLKSTAKPINESSDFGKIILNKFQKILGLQEAGCGYCLQDVSILETEEKSNSPHNHGPPYYIVSLALYSDRNCREARIIDMMAIPIGKEMKLKIQGVGTIVFALSLDKLPPYQIKRLIPPIDRKTSSIFRITKICPAIDSINFAVFKLCPTVTLTSEDYSLVMKKSASTTTRDKINALFGLCKACSDAPKTVDVCFDDYISAVSEINGAVVFACSRIAFEIYIILRFV